MSLVVAAQPSDLVAVEHQCSMVEAWAESCTSIPELRDASNKLAAISEYLELTATEGRARVAAAQRRLEVRIGHLLGPATPNGGHGAGPGTGSFASDPVASDDLTANQRSDFRRMAENEDIVERTIDASTDEAPASRRKVTEAIKGARKPTDRESVAARVARAKEMAAQGCTSRQIAAELGTTVGAFTAFKARHGVVVPADQTVGKFHHINHDRVVNETTQALEGLCIGIGIIGDPTEAGLDPDQIEGWVTSMSNSLRLLNRFHKQLKEMTQ